MTDYVLTDSSPHTITPPHNPTTINIFRPDELRWWITELEITREQMVRAILVVGTDALMVREWLAA